MQQGHHRSWRCDESASWVTPTTESDVFLAGARTAWTFVENNTQASTGLAKAHDNFQFVTTWDIASQIAATYSAHELGIIDDANYDGRIKKILATLTTLPLYQGAAFNRFYDSQTGQMVDRNFNASTTGFGWSTTDIGRLLTWLRVLAVNQPQYSAQATAIKNRLNMSRLISGGTLQGVDVDANGNTVYVRGDRTRLRAIRGRRVRVVVAAGVKFLESHGDRKGNDRSRSKCLDRWTRECAIDQRAIHHDGTGDWLVGFCSE